MDSRETSVNEKSVNSSLNEEKTSFRKEIFEWLEVIVTAMVAVVLVFTFFVRIATIDGSSMENTLYGGEKVLISKIGYTPKQGDIVVISRNYNNIDPSDIKWPDNIYSSEPIIKRIIALEGQTVDIDFEKGIVYVDGKKIDDSYTKTPTNQQGDVQFPVIVPENCVFVLGDNRNNSSDSRISSLGENGMLNKDYIIGRVIFRIFPFNKAGGIS